MISNSMLSVNSFPKMFSNSNNSISKNHPYKFIFADIFYKNGKIYILAHKYRNNYKLLEDNLVVKVNDSILKIESIIDKDFRYEPCQILIYNTGIKCNNIKVLVKYKNLSKEFNLEHIVSKTTKTFGVTTLFKNDFRLFKIFYDYYVKQGVDKFYMYYNGIISDEIKKTFLLPNVNLIEWNFRYWDPEIEFNAIHKHHAQHIQMMNALYKYGKDNHEWMGFFDLDEYLNTKYTIKYELLKNPKIDVFGFKNCWAETMDKKIPSEFPETFRYTDKNAKYDLNLFKNPSSKNIYKTSSIKTMTVHYPDKFAKKNCKLNIENKFFHFYNWGTKKRSFKMTKTFTRQYFKKNMVFISAGDNTNFDILYINDNMNYDIYVIYYGNNKTIYNKYKNKVKFIEMRKGSKFQNFKYFYDNYKYIINCYEYFFILDDDIIFNYDDINNMFSTAKQHNLSICGPSFKKGSKISHKITKQKDGILLTYTNFIEVNVPLFNKVALNKFMKYMDSNLIGWGIDFLYIWANGLENKKSYAIIHDIGCINPEDNCKNNKRELQLIKNCNNRQTIWENYADKIGCPRRYEICEYEDIICKDKSKASKVIFRILGNDLSGIHGNCQTYQNLKFTLENEYPFEDTDKIYILNRIYEKKKKKKLIKLLNKYKAKYYEIKFDLNIFLKILCKFKSKNIFIDKCVDNNLKNFIIKELIDFNFYLINNNGSRNYALKLGKLLKYKWIFVIDSNNYFLKSDFNNIFNNLQFNTEYIVIPQKRLVDSNLPNDILLDNSKVSTINELLEREAQIGFKSSSTLYFDERRPYGISPKAEMLYQLGYDGPWEKWIKNGKNLYKINYRKRVINKYNYIKSNKIIRLNPYCKNYKFENNSKNRMTGLKNLIKKIIKDNSIPLI